MNGDNNKKALSDKTIEKSLFILRAIKLSIMRPQFDKAEHSRTEEKGRMQLPNKPLVPSSRGRRLIIFLCLLPLIGLIAMVSSHYLEHGWSDFHVFLREIAFACLIATVAIVTIGFAEKEERDKAFEEESERRKQDYEALEVNITTNVGLLEGSRKVGLEKVYPTRFDIADDLIKDIAKSSKSCRMYVGVYFSELFDRADFMQAIAAAAKNAKERSYRETQPIKYKLCFTSLSWSLDDENSCLVKIWNKKELPDTDLKEFSRYLYSNSCFRFRRVVETSKKYSAESNFLDESHRVFKDYPCPRAMCIIDDEIIYVGIYDWSNAQGTEAPAMRLRNGAWARIFLDEAKQIDCKFSSDLPAPPSGYYTEPVPAISAS